MRCMKKFDGMQKKHHNKKNTIFSYANQLLCGTSQQIQLTSLLRDVPSRIVTPNYHILE